MPVVGDDPAGDDARDEQPADHADRHQPGVRRGHAAGELEVLREVDRRAEHRDTDQHRRGGGEGGGAVLEEPQRDDRVLGDVRLDQDRGDDDDQAGHDEADAGGGAPGELVARERDPDEQQRDAAHQQRGAEVVDVDLALDHRQVQGLLEYDEGEQRHREAGEEAPAPADRVDEQATDERAADRGEGEGRADVAAVAAALTRRDHRGDDDLDEGGQTADAEALDGAGADQHLHRRREAGDDRADREDDQGALDEQLLGELVGELAPDRGGGRHRQQGRDDDPGVAGLAALEVGHDRRQGVGHDGAGEHRDEHREEEATEGLEHLAVGHLPRLFGGGGCCGR